MNTTGIFCMAGIQLPTPSWGYSVGSLESLVGAHHNSRPGLERSGSSFTSTISVSISLSLLLLECLQLGANCLRQAAAFCSSPNLKKCSHSCPDTEKCRLLHWSLFLSLHFSSIYSFLAQIGTGDRSCVLYKQMCGHLGCQNARHPFLQAPPLTTQFTGDCLSISVLLGLLWGRGGLTLLHEHSPCGPWLCFPVVLKRPQMCFPE